VEGRVALERLRQLAAYVERGQVDDAIRVSPSGLCRHVLELVKAFAMEPDRALELHTSAALTHLLAQET